MDSHEKLVADLVNRVKSMGDHNGHASKSIEQLRDVIERVRRELQELKVSGSGGGAGHPAAPGGGSGPCSAGCGSAGAQPCHCACVDGLIKRVGELESWLSMLTTASATSGQAHVAAAPATAEGPDPWGGFSCFWGPPAPPGVDSGAQGPSAADGARGHGGDDPDGGGGGGGGGDRGHQYGRWARGRDGGRDGDERIIYSKLFDDKVAQSSEFQ